MIVSTWKRKDYTIELVDGEDIMKTYKDGRLVKSCMSHYGRWRATRFYTFIEGLKLLRFIANDTVHLRSLIWDVKDPDDEAFKFVDVVYAEYTARRLFPDIWPRYADKRTTNKPMIAKILPNRMRTIPYIDTFMWTDKKIMSTEEYLEGYNLSDWDAVYNSVLETRRGNEYW